MPAFLAHFDIIYTSCNDHDMSCGHQAKRQKMIGHIGNTLNKLKKTSKTGRNVGFNDILTTGNPGNNSKFLFFKKMRGESFKNTSNK